jgi:CheY-like chemotaxis protein
MQISRLNPTYGTDRPLRVQPCRILLIEDSLDDQIYAKRELQNSQFVKDVVSFNDGGELIDYMEKQGYMDRSVLLLTPVMILVDLEMPNKDGLQVIRELKSDPFLEPIPLVVVTGSKDEDKIAKARAFGANGVFAKPLRCEALDAYFQEAWKWPPAELWLQ